MSILCVACFGLANCGPSDPVDPVTEPPVRESPAGVTNSEELDFARKRVERIANMDDRGKLEHDTIRFTCANEGLTGYYVRTFFDHDLVRVRLMIESSGSATYHLDEGTVYAAEIRSGEGRNRRYYYAGNLIASEGEERTPPLPRERLLGAAAAGKVPCD